MAMKNVILITLDATRKDVFGLYGNKRGLTPFMDSLKGDSLVFTGSQSAGPYTQASFPAILCSGYYLDYGKPQGLSPQRPIISEELHKAGIFTAGFHSNPYCSSMLGWERGWDIFYDSMDDDLDDDRIPYIRGNVINEKVTGWLAEHTQKSSYAPFFLWVHYMDVHEPYMPERRHVEMVDPSIDISQDQMYAMFEDVLLKRDVSDPTKVALLKRLYDVHVREVDTYVESLFSSLGSTGVLKDTAVLITSDHGDEFNEHGGLSHDDKLYSELIDVPLLIYGAGEKGRCNDVVSSVDIPPTVLNLLGVQPSPAFQGRSLLPSTTVAAKGVFGEAINQKTAKGGDLSRDSYFCRMGDLKLIYRADSGQTELYNLANDPGERLNIAGSAAEPDKLQRELKPRVRRWVK